MIRQMRRLFGLAVLLAGFAATMSAPAFADTPAIPNDGAAPWVSGPNVTSPLEALAGSVATTIAKRPVSVRCRSEAEWVQQLGEQLAKTAKGFVDYSSYSDGRIARIADVAELSPQVCVRLWAFALSAAKPTKCETTRAEQRTVTRTKRVAVRKRVRVQVRVRGKTVWRWRTKTVWTNRKVTETETVEVKLPPAGCYTGTASLTSSGMPVSYWTEYASFAEAFLVLTHEAVHLAGFVGHVGANGVAVGYADSEARATCYGMQWIRHAAEQFGTTSDDASAIARFAYERVYPDVRTRSPDYWSPDCVPAGPLDLRMPGAGPWTTS